MPSTTMLHDASTLRENKENELPHLLLHSVRHVRPCKTSHGNRKLAPDSRSTGGLDSSLVSQPLKSSKSLCLSRDSKTVEDLSLSPSRSHNSSSSDDCHKAFPVKAAPLQRWRAAAKIQTYLSKWRQAKGRSHSDPNPQVGSLRVMISSCSSQPSMKLWPEEPEAPLEEDLDALTELEAMLLEQHGSMVAAHKFITDCVKTVKRGNSGNDAAMTARELRIALHLKASKQATPSHSSEMLEQMFDRLLRLLRRKDGDISKADFLRFPELLRREKDLRANAHHEVLLGNRLQDRLEGSIESAEMALQVLQETSVAMQLEPVRTTNLLFQIAKAPSGPSGLTVAVCNIMRIAQSFGGPSQGVKLDVLLISWSLCSALTKQVQALGAPTADMQFSKSQSKPAKSSFLKVKGKANKFVKRYQCKVILVDFSPTQLSNDEPDPKHADECNVAFWQAVPTGEVLWNVGCGAEALDEKGFKRLLAAAWNLFDDFDAVACILGPVGLGRMRPKLDALLAMDVEPQVLRKDPEQLQRAGILLQQIASLCQADPRLARIAALFGVSFTVDRVLSTANASVNFADGAVGSAAAQVNRSVGVIAEELEIHVEELLGGRSVECCLSSGQFKIFHAAGAVENPLAEYHQSITAQVMEKATVKQLHMNNMEKQGLRPFEKFLLGYSNMQDL